MPLLNDQDWARLEPLMPHPGRKGGRPWRDHRLVVEAIVWRYRTGCPWRDLPAEFGPWQTVWARHRAWSEDGTWDNIHTTLLAQADAAGLLDWSVNVDSTINRSPAGVLTPHMPTQPVHRYRRTVTSRIVGRHPSGSCASRRTTVPHATPWQPQRRHHSSGSTTWQASTALPGSSRCPTTSRPSSSTRQNVVRSGQEKVALRTSRSFGWPV